ncbi:MAG TPA: ABC transporter substrate-binding protein [Nitrososphaeraceae archaeon]|nr:ABC transporter substrate-binding protein [Nitrososphaeraceae archaeon]
MEKIGLALEWFPNVDHVPILSGMNEGFFYNEDIELHVMTPVNHEAGIELASAGKLDFAITEPIHLPSARAKGLPIVAVGKYFETGFGIMTVGRDINSLKDLKGKTIAVSLETHAPLIVKAMLHYDGGIDLSEDLRFIDAGYYLVDSLLEKKADVAYGVFENYEMIEAKYRGLEEIKLFKFTDYGVPSFGYLVFVTNERNIRERKEIISKFLRGIRKSIEFTLNNPQDSLESFLEALPVLNNELNRHIYSHTLKCYKTDTSLRLEECERLATFANTNHLTGSSINGKEMIANL